MYKRGISSVCVKGVSHWCLQMRHLIGMRIREARISIVWFMEWKMYLETSKDMNWMHLIFQEFMQIMRGRGFVTSNFEY